MSIVPYWVLFRDNTGSLKFEEREGWDMRPLWKTANFTEGVVVNNSDALKATYRKHQHPDPSSKWRTFAKALGWECFSFLLTLLVSWLVVGSMGKATILTVILFVLKVGFLFLYERIWHNIRWGKLQ